MSRIETFSRTALLTGVDKLEEFTRRRVIIFGMGGVGSWTAETLVRTGYTDLTIVDADCVAQSNINRQLPATVNTIGEAKVDVMRRHLLEINPDANITAIHGFYNAATADSYDLTSYDYIIDAIDSLTDKALLILRATAAMAECRGETSAAMGECREGASVAMGGCREGASIATKVCREGASAAMEGGLRGASAGEGKATRRVMFFSSMGAALKLDPMRISVAEFWKVKGCPLAAALRRKFKKSGVFPQRKFKCVFSDELVPNHPLPSPIGNDDADGVRDGMAAGEGAGNAGEGKASENVAGNARVSRSDAGEGGPMMFNKVAVNGSVMHITAIFGMTLASLVIRDTIG